MTRPRLTVAEVIRSCLDEFLERYGPELSPERHRALKDLVSCRTAALGGHVLGCPECGHQQIAYNPCGNRPGIEYQSGEGPVQRPIRTAPVNARREAAQSCAEHVRQPGGASPLHNLMEVKC